MILSDGVKACLARKNLTEDDMTSIMKQIMCGNESEVQVAAFLTAMRMKGECIAELVGGARTMRALAKPISIDFPNMVDITGTGGDDAHLFNISSASTFVVASAGANIVKHGGSAVSSTVGSADLFRHLGVEFTLSPAAISRCIEKTGIGFLYAPFFHETMKQVSGVRRTLGFRTIFNILGPLSNPAGVKRLLVGVFSKELVQLMVQAFSELGAEHVLVVHADNGLDEISISGRTNIGELRGGKIREYSVVPEDFDIRRTSLNGLRVENTRDSWEIIYKAFSNKGKKYEESVSKAADIIALNAGAAIYVSGVVDSFVEGISTAKEILNSGKALKTLNEFVGFFNTNELGIG